LPTPSFSPPFSSLHPLFFKFKPCCPASLHHKTNLSLHQFSNLHNQTRAPYNLQTEHPRSQPTSCNHHNCSLQVQTITTIHGFYSLCPSHSIKPVAMFQHPLPKSPHQSAPLPSTSPWLPSAQFQHHTCNHRSRHESKPRTQIHLCHRTLIPKPNSHTAAITTPLKSPPRAQPITASPHQSPAMS
jgi:hypothetical protein